LWSSVPLAALKISSTVGKNKRVTAGRDHDTGSKVPFRRLSEGVVHHMEHRTTGRRLSAEMSVAAYNYG